MSSLNRMLTILDCVTPEEPILTTEQIVDRLGYSKGTTYRYLRELSAFGLLSRIDGGFTLGPRVIELDRSIRLADPILKASVPIMHDLCEEFSADVILVSYFDDRVVVTHHELGDDKIKVTYGRGTRMPLFRGAAAKAVLSTLPIAKQRRLFKAYLSNPDKKYLPTNWKDFRKELVNIQKTRVALSFGELDNGNVGVSTPILHEGPYPPGSVCLVFSSARYKIIDKNLVQTAIIATADLIHSQIKKVTTQDPDMGYQLPRLQVS